MRRADWNNDWTYYSREQPEKKTKVTLPHDAMIHEKRIPKLIGGETSAYFPGGKYIYEKQFIADESMAEGTVLLEFDGVYQKSRVFLDSECLGGRVNGSSQFLIDLTGRLKPSREHVISVEADNTQVPNSRWYTGSGIYRGVRLLTSGLTYITPGGAKLKTTDEHTLLVTLAVNSPEGDAKPEIRLNIRKDREAAQFCEVSIRVKEQPGGYLFEYELKVESPEPWSAENPVLYELRAEVLNAALGEKLDTECFLFGFRTITVDAQNGFCVNGAEIKLRGACIHQDNGILGAAAHREAVYRKATRLKEAGFNAVRTAHNSPSRYLLEACDEIGLYVMLEFSDVWRAGKNEYDYALYFDGEWERDIASMVEKAGSHPSVIIYSVGNEIYDLANEEGARTNQMLCGKLWELDGTRPVTNCFNVLGALRKPSAKPLKRPSVSPGDLSDPRREGPQSPLIGSKLLNMAVVLMPKISRMVKPKQIEENIGGVLDNLDIVGFNYGTHLSESLHKLSPRRVMVHSETYPSLIGQTWDVTKRSRHVVGDFMWTGWDYLGEAGIGVCQYGSEMRRLNKPYPCICAGTGVIDITGYLTASAHYAKTVFTGEKTPYIAVRPLQYSGQKRKMSTWRFTDAVHSWSFPGYEGVKANIEVYSAADSVELFLNGNSFSRSKVREYTARFTVSYEPGCLSAVAYEADGSQAGWSEIKSASEKIRLHLVPEEPIQTLKNSIYGYSSDESKTGLIFINIALTDEAGTCHILRDQLISVKVEGGGELAAIGSGNPITQEEYTGDSFTT